MIADGPRVVAIGGGHGLAVTLDALKQYASDISAIVSVADDGGSSGRLREAMSVVPPGDIRRCLGALADADSLIAKAFEYRFGEGELSGHALGNLVLLGLASTAGDIQSGIDEAGRLLGAAGRVFPAALEPVVLMADTDGGHVKGQSAVMSAGGIRRLSWEPAAPKVSREAIEALAAADQVVIGPGSLYTSLIAAGALPGIVDALATTPGRCVYVANLREQRGETAGYDVAAHVRALRAHGVRVDTVVADRRGPPLGDPAVPVLPADVSRNDLSGHDADLLAAVLVSLCT